MTNVYSQKNVYRNMKYLMNGVLVVCILFFASCEGNTNYYWDVENNSSSDVTLFTEITGNINALDTVVIAVGETKRIGNTDQMGGRKNLVDASGSIKNFYARQGNKMIDSTIYRTANRWDETVKEKSKRPADYWHYYTLTLVDGDFL